MMTMAQRHVVVVPAAAAAPEAALQVLEEALACSSRVVAVAVAVVEVE